MPHIVFPSSVDKTVIYIAFVYELYYDTPIVQVGQSVEFIGGGYGA